MTKMTRHLSLCLVFSLMAVLSQAYTGDALFQAPQMVGKPPKASAQVADRVRICSYNIQNFNDAKKDEPERKKKHFKQQAADAAALLDKIQADVVILQEIENASVLKRLNKEMTTSYAHNYITQFDYVKDRNAKLNIAVLSRLPLTDLQEIDFSQLKGDDRPSRGLLKFSIDMGNHERLLVYGVHLKSNWGEREENVARRKSATDVIRADMERVRRNRPTNQWHTIVVGDMNLDPDAVEFKDDTSLNALSTLVDLWRGRPLEERTTHPTRAGKGKKYPAVAFDRILVARSLLQEPWVVGPAHVLQEGVYLEDAAVRPGMRAGHVSDHYPIYVDIFRAKPDQ